jgi:hypothetical protein
MPFWARGRDFYFRAGHKDHSRRGIFPSIKTD